MGLNPELQDPGVLPQGIAEEVSEACALKGVLCRIPRGVWGPNALRDPGRTIRVYSGALSLDSRKSGQNQFVPYGGE